MNYNFVFDIWLANFLILSSKNKNRAFVWLVASKFLNIDFNGQSSNENLNSVFGEKGTAAGKFFNLAFKRPKKNSNSAF